MKAMFIVLACTLALCGCVMHPYQPPIARTPDFAHLKIKGSWGVHSDIWIYSDDSYVATEFNPANRRIEKSETGLSKGLFQSIIRYMARRNAWTITTAGLIADVREASRRRDISPPDVTDMDADFLEIHFSKKVFQANFYATWFTLEKLPEVKSLATFSHLVKQIQEETLAPNRNDGTGSRGNGR